MRAFTLLETMVVVAILSIVAALAVPNLLPLLRQQRHAGHISATAGFLGRARQEAMSRRRCVRVLVTDDHTLVAETLNAFDCDAPDEADRLDVDQPLYAPLATMRLDDGGTLAFGPAPRGRPRGEPAQLRFRPTGRLWSVDGRGLTAPTSDPGAVRVALAGFADQLVIVEPQGLICTRAVPVSGAPSCR